MFQIKLGCDVGPRKGCDIFDGREWKRLTPQEFLDYVEKVRHKPNTLLAWEAPLTGPSNPDGPINRVQDLTQRLIETFFRTKDWGFKAPTGISVQPYCNCSHWTLTHRILGLPRIGKYSLAAHDLPLRLLLQQEDLKKKPDGRASVVEVHSAVAMWLWCRNTVPPAFFWNYKGDRNQVDLFWKEIRKRVKGTKQLPTPETDDELDAMVAWLLADRWVRGSGVTLLGNQWTGSFLVPDNKALVAAFNKFLRALSTNLEKTDP